MRESPELSAAKNFWKSLGTPNVELTNFVLNSDRLRILKTFLESCNPLTESKKIGVCLFDIRRVLFAKMAESWNELHDIPRCQFPLLNFL